VNVQVGYLLAGALTDGMPDRHPVRSERRLHRQCDAGDRCYQRRFEVTRQLGDVVDVLGRNHQDVPRVKLPRIDQGQDLGGPQNETGSLCPIDDPAEDTLVHLDPHSGRTRRLTVPRTRDNTDHIMRTDISTDASSTAASGGPLVLPVLLVLVLS
jgi:hypothetical protein